MEGKTLINKNDISIKKNNTGFHITFCIENAVMNLSTLININLIKLIYDLNADLFEKIHIENLNDSEATIFILCKDIFNELGFAHFFFYFNIKHHKAENHFTITSNLNMANNDVTSNMEHININNCTISYINNNNSINNASNKILFKIEIASEDTGNTFTPIIEKIISNIIYKIINRVKQFVHTIGIVDA